MIKKWGNFINENFLQEAKKKVTAGFIGEEEINNLITEDFIKKVQKLFIYTEYRYSELSKDIRKFLNESFPGSRWTHGWISLKSVFQRHSYGDKTIYIVKIADFLEKIKPDFDNEGYPSQSELCEKIEYICLNSLDQDIVEFFEAREEWNGIYIELIIRTSDSSKAYANLTVDKLLEVSEELTTLKNRVIEEVKKLKNTELHLYNNGNITMIFEHN